MENRKAHRVVFERGYAANMMAIDGTWRRPCTVEDVSDTGAKLTVEGAIDGLNLKEFFLLLSTMGNAYRRCQLSWVNGDQVGVYFLKPGNKKKLYRAGQCECWRGLASHSLLELVMADVDQEQLLCGRI